MARFVGAVQDTGFLRNNNFEFEQKKNPYQDLLKNQIVNDECLKNDFAFNNIQRVETEVFNEEIEESNLKFWMNIIKPKKESNDFLKNQILKVKFIEILIALITFFAILIAQFEYEIEYFPKNYGQCVLIVQNTTLNNSTSTISENTTDYVNITGFSDSDLDCTYQGHPIRVILSIYCAVAFVSTIYCAHTKYIIKLEQRKINVSIIFINFSFLL